MESQNLNIPAHIAIIMDGNGRWAKKQGKERIEGHYEGVVSVRSAIESSLDFGVKYLTIYAFSTENWGRPQDEVEGLMELFCKTIFLEIPSLIEQQVKVVFLGDLDALSEDVRKSVEMCHSQTKDFDKLTLCVALNYGARAEMVYAIKKIAEKVKNSQLEIEDIDDKLVEDNLFTANIPSPDLIIRSSGEQRLSNFLLWQGAYSELYFTTTLWPEFRKESFLAAIEEYSKRVRRFGKVL